MPKKTVREDRGLRKKVSSKRTQSRTKPPGKTESTAENPAPPPDVGPFDADFFESQFPNLLRPADEAAKPIPPQPYVVTLVLGDGMLQLEIAQIDELSDQWGLFSVYEGHGQRDGSSPSRFVFVPYAAIARIEVSGSESRTAPIGFHRKPAEKRTKRKQSARKKKAAPRKRT